MAHLQYMPGDPRLVDQLVYELKSKGIFDQFRKECIADVDTRPAYQNLRQRVESSVTLFLSRQTWKSDLNKNQLREKLRKHILDGNYLEQGVERIVDQVVNPKVASVFIPQVEDLVYNYLGIPRKKKAETPEKTTKDLLPTDLEAVSPGSVKSNDEESKGSENKVQDMEIDSEGKTETTEDMSLDTQKDDLVEVSSDSTSMDKSSIPLPTEEIKLENIPAPENSPTPAKVELENIELPTEPDKPSKVELKNIELPKEPNLSTDIPLPDEVRTKIQIFKPMALHSEDSNSSSGSSIRRNMSPLTPVRNFDDENSCDAQQAFENNDVADYKEPSSFRFNIETKESNDSSDVKEDKKETELSYQFNNQVNINTYNTPMYDDSSNSHNLQIDYESDANTNTSKTTEVKQEVEIPEDSKKEKKDDKKSHKSSHRSRDSSRHSSSKDKHSSSRDSSRHDKKPKEEKTKSSKERERSKDRSDKKDSSKHKSSHKSSSSSKDKHRSSSSSHRHSGKSSDDRKSSNNKSSEKDKERSSGKSSRDKKDSKSSSHRDKDRKSSKKDDKDKKKEKKDVDDHYNASGRGNHSRRSTDRDSNDGSSSSKGSQSQNNSKSTTESKKESKSSSSKSDNTSTSGETSQSDKEHNIVANKVIQSKPIRVDNHLETPIANPPRLPFVPDVTLKKPKFANNFEEAKKMMRMRKFLAEEQKRMNQEAALLLEFQANVRPSLSQVYSSIPGPELEFACITNTETPTKTEVEEQTLKEEIDITITETLPLEPPELKHIAKGTAEIINDIIGVPIDYEQVISINEIRPDTQNNKENNKEIEKVEVKNENYDENKPFSQLVDEIDQHGKAERQDSLEESLAEIVHDNSTEFEIKVTETLSESDVSEMLEMNDTPKPNELHYFAEEEKFNAELERHKFSDFLKKYTEKASSKAKMYVINCDTYEENIVKEIANSFGDYEIVNYFKNGHLVPNRNIVKDVPLCAEISLPIDSNDYDEKSPIFSPVKSECSFELSSDYDAKLDEIVNKKSRQEVMEIILGSVLDEASKMPTIDYYTDLSETDNPTIVEEEIQSSDNALKRRIEDGVNKQSILSPNKIRKISDSDQISSTTEEPEVSNNNKPQTAARSKFLGRAKRVGLPRPKRCNLPNSPSSDKSVENYTQNTPTPPNGKLKSTPRSKVQRYETSDLYKPKLHYLSRRNNVS